MSGNNGSFRSLAVAIESTALNPDSNGVPTASGLTFAVADVERVTLTAVPGESVADQREATRDGPYEEPPLPGSAYDSGNSRWYERREGEITVEMYVDPIGASGLSYDAHPLRRMLGTVFAEVSDPAAATDTPSAGVSSNVFTAGTVGNYSEGALFTSLDSGSSNGTVVSQVTDISGNDVTHSPAIVSGGMTASDTIRFMRTLYLPPGGTSPALGSIALRIDGIGVRAYAFGCVMSGLELSEMEGTNKVKATVTLQSPYITTDHSNADVDEAVLFGQLFAYRLSAPTALSTAAAGTTSPYTLARTDVEPETGATLTLTTELAQDPYTSVAAPYKLCPTMTSVEWSGTLATAASLVDNDFESRTQRTLCQAYGPNAAGGGFAWLIPRAHLTGSAKARAMEDNTLVKQPLAYRAGNPKAVNDTSAIARSPLLIGFGL